MDKESVSEKQLFLLVTGFTVGTSILLAPTMSIDLARQDAWLSPLLAVVPGFLLVAVLAALNKMYPGQSLVQYSVSILGLPGKLAGLLMIWFALHLSALVLRNIGNFVSTVMLIETPSPLIHAAVALLAAFGVRLGIECIARAMSVLLPASLVFFLLIQAITTPAAKLANLAPVLSKGMLPVVQASVNLSTFPVGEIVLFSMLIYHVKTTGKKGKKGVFMAAGLLLGMLILTLGILRTITILGPYLSARTSYAVFFAVNSYRSGNYLCHTSLAGLCHTH
ncbi:MAG: GerAB/ArcD/ProY family transporter [Bacillota bacterium]|nr:spore germination protein [Bacillota bacterium]